MQNGDNIMGREEEDADSLPEFLGIHSLLSA